MQDREKQPGYECGHCGEVKQGQPFMQVIVDEQHLDVCCVGCACAAQFIDRYQNQLTSQPGS
jgi:hypothetical protein